MPPSPKNGRYAGVLPATQPQDSSFNERISVNTGDDLGSDRAFSLRRWSSRTFRYGYLVTTSPQS